jgi:hypothetical protein
MPIAEYKEELLNEFEARSDEWGFADFERRLRDVHKDISYHDVKSIINDAHNVGRWPNTVKRYLLTNYEAHGNVSSEFSGTLSDIRSSMTDREKEDWGLS